MGKIRFGAMIFILQSHVYLELKPMQGRSISWSSSCVLSCTLHSRTLVWEVILEETFTSLRSVSAVFVFVLQALRAKSFNKHSVPTREAAFSYALCWPAFLYTFAVKLSLFKGKWLSGSLPRLFSADLLYVLKSWSYSYIQ